MRITVLLLLACLLVPVVAAEEKPADAPSDAGESIFDGKTLDGWKSPDMSFWRVEDGAITGEVTADKRPPENNFIVWQGGKVSDFELTFKFRIFGEKANSGMQFRSEVRDRGLVHGYQADMSGDGRLVGNVFDEYGPRGQLAGRGEAVTWDKDGKKDVKPVAGAGDPFKDAPLDPKQWNEYRITAKGEHVTIHVNGKLTTELHDADPRHRLEGVLAMPVIPEPMKVRYKDLRLKRL
jgi:hypothetical protein